MGWPHYQRATNLPEGQLAIAKDSTMGDKGGKKDKEKSKKQKADQEGQKAKGKQEKSQSK